MQFYINKINIHLLVVTHILTEKKLAYYESLLVFINVVLKNTDSVYSNFLS